MDGYLPLRFHGGNESSLGSPRICQPDATQTQVTLDSPALDVMTDLTKVSAVVIEPEATMEVAHAFMVQRGVRMLLVVHHDQTLAGIITATDLLGEKPVRVAREQRIHHSEIRVADLMTPVARLEAFQEISQLSSARVGHIVSSLQHARRHHALVLQRGADGRPEVRGIFSLSQIARQLGMPLQLPDAADSFAEIEAALA